MSLLDGGEKVELDLKVLLNIGSSRMKRLRIKLLIIKLENIKESI